MVPETAQKKMTIFATLGIELAFTARNHPMVLLCNALKQAGHNVCFFLKPQETPDALRYVESGVKIFQPHKKLYHWSRLLHIVVKGLILSKETVRRRGALRKAREICAYHDFLLFNYAILSFLLTRVAMREKPHILQVFAGNKWAGKAMEWGYSRGLPVVYTEAGSLDPDLPPYRVLPHYIQRCQRVILPSNLLLSNLRALGYKGEVEIIPFAVPDPGPLQMPRRPDGQVVIGSAARVDFSKGPQFLVQSASLLKNRFPNVPFKIIIAGDGPHRSACKKMATELGVEDQVEFPGAFFSYEELNEFMTSIDIFALASQSRSEGQPVSLVEALAYGKPVVSTKIAGIPDLLMNDNGFLLEPGDIDALTEALSVLLRDERLRKDMGRRSRELYLANHRLDNMVEKYLKVYAEVS